MWRVDLYSLYMWSLLCVLESNRTGQTDNMGTPGYDHVGTGLGLGYRRRDKQYKHTQRLAMMRLDLT